MLGGRGSLHGLGGHIFMATVRKLSDFVQYLELFCDIASELEKAPGSLREITERLGLSSVSVVSTCIKRIEADFGKKLVDITSTSGRNTLTADGQWLLRNGTTALEKLQEVRSASAQAITTKPDTFSS